MRENQVSVGNCVLKLQEAYYFYNPCIAAQNIHPVPKEIIDNVSRLNKVNMEIGSRLSSLYHVLLRKNKSQIKIHSEQLLEYINNTLFTEIKDLIKSGGISVMWCYYLFNSWSLLWMLNKLKEADPIEDIDYADMYNLLFTDQDRQEQLDLRESIFNIDVDDIDSYDLEGFDDEDERKGISELYELASLYLSDTTEERYNSY